MCLGFGALEVVAGDEDGDVFGQSRKTDENLFESFSVEKLGIRRPFEVGTALETDSRLGS